MTGDFREYGPTSMFKHLSATGGSTTSPGQFEVSPSTSNNTGSGNVAVLKLSDIRFDEKMHQKTLRAYFTFFNPWCLWVDEKRFREDLGDTIFGMGTIVRRNLRTACYSPLLHFAMLAIGVMYLDNGFYADRELLSDTFARNATTFFEEEIEIARESTVVGMMLLGTHHAGHARQSLGYIYSGNGLRLTRIRESFLSFV